MKIVDVTKEYECCCSCKHNIRKGETYATYCECEIDNHYIGYVANFESVCEEWADADGYAKWVEGFPEDKE